MQRHGGIVVARGIRRIVAISKTGVSSIAVAEHRLLDVSDTVPPVDSNTGKGSRDLTNGLTFRGNSLAVVAAGVLVRGAHLRGYGRIERSQIAVAGKLD